MPQYVHVPLDRLESSLLTAMIEEFVTRDGTDYGVNESSLQEKVTQLERQLRAGDVWIVFESESEQWDWLPADEAAQLVGN